MNIIQGHSGYLKATQCNLRKFKEILGNPEQVKWIQGKGMVIKQMFGYTRVDLGNFR